MPYDAATNVFINKNQGGKIVAGDTIMLLNGLHGDIFLRNYVNEKTITIMGMEGHKAILKILKIQGGKNWRFENLHISSEIYDTYINSKLVHFESHGWQGPCSNIKILNCEIYSTEFPWSTADEWINNASDGIYMFGDSMRAENNKVYNIDMGITAYGDHIEAKN